MDLATALSSLHLPWTFTWGRTDSPCTTNCPFENTKWLQKYSSRIFSFSFFQICSPLMKSIYSWKISSPVAPNTNSFLWVQFSSVQSLSCVQLFVTPWTAACQASLSTTNSRSSLRLNVHRVSDAIQPSHPLSSPSPPAPNPSQHQGLFQWVNSSHEVAKVLEFQL